MSTPPTASIVVPTRGGADRLPVLFRALAAQDCTDFEVLPVLDGDVDGSADVVAELTRHTGLEVRPVVFDENRGRSAALNAGIAAARGDVLIRCDDDLEPTPKYVRAHVARHEAATRPIGVVGPYANRLPENPYARAYGRPASERALRDVLAAGPQTAWRHWAGNVSLTAETAARVGGYDEGYRRYGWEDVDYGYRVHAAGVPVAIAPELVTPHHMAATTTVSRALRALHAGAARERFVQLHGEVLPNSLKMHMSPWGTSVTLASKLITEKSLRILGAGVDGLLPVVPRPIGEKLVALLVESAGLAGTRRPERARTTF